MMAALKYRRAAFPIPAIVGFGSHEVVFWREVEGRTCVGLPNNTPWQPAAVKGERFRQYGSVGLWC